MMNKPPYIVLAGIFIMFLCFNNHLIGQNNEGFPTDPEAKKLMNQVSNKLDAAESIKVDFEMSMLIPGEEIDIQEGLLLQNGDKFLFDINSQMIVSNETAVYVYLKDDNEIQINDPDFGEDGSLLSPAQMMRLYETESFFYAITDQTNEATKIEFKPEDIYSDYSKLRITIDHRANEIKRIEIFSKDGSRIYIDVASTELNPSIGIDAFDFDTDKFPNAYIEDLRID